MEGTAGMTYFCYVYSKGSATPYMEAVPVRDQSEAEALCLRILCDHRDATRAELFENDRPVAVMRREAPYEPPREEAAPPQQS